MELRTKRILWLGPGLYQEFRDRQTLQFLWVLIDTLPEKYRIDLQDGVYFRNVPTDFELVENFALTDEIIYGLHGVEQPSNDEYQSSCAAFGWGFVESEEACIKCGEETPHEQKKCAELTLEKRNYLKEQGWEVEDNPYAIHPQVKRKYNLKNAYLIARGDESYLKTSEENPFERGTKSSVLFDLIQSGKHKTRDELRKEFENRVPGGHKTSSTFLRVVLNMWKKKVPRTNLKVVEDEKGIRFEERKE